MPDIRLARSRGVRLWAWIGALVLAALVAWVVGSFVADPTDPDRQPGVGAAAGFGDQRAPVIPPRALPFSSLVPLQERDLGQLVHLTGIAESPVVASSVWVRSGSGHRILARFEPPPPPATLRGIGPGVPIDMDGYLTKISRAEFRMWIDTLGVSLPQPPPGRKFGDLPDPRFARIDALYIKDFYVSVRPDEVTDANGE